MILASLHQSWSDGVASIPLKVQNKTLVLVSDHVLELSLYLYACMHAGVVGR